TLGGGGMMRRGRGGEKGGGGGKQCYVGAEGAEKNGINAELAMKIFDLGEKFAGYGFNKSHSAAYALVSYQTLWLKAHYPAEFMA
ncbi:DNA polymerase III subunit alpha, partial [Escherichia coli]